MKNYFICLIDSDSNGVSYQRGDIVTRKPRTGPPGIPWASFNPPAELEGTPVLAHTADYGSGDLVFRYTDENGMGFLVSARHGMPQASVMIEKRKPQAKDDSPLQQPQEIKLEYGAGLVASSARSFVGFVSRSRFQAAPVKKSTIYDNPLTWGLED